MAKRLTEQERNERDVARAADAAAQAKAFWHEKLAATLPMTATAGAMWDDALENRKLTLRDLWLVLAVFETEEKIHLSGSRESCKTKWFDNVVPHARKGKFGKSYGSAGFTARTAHKAEFFLKLSRNGYIWLTDLGYALGQELRKRHPELASLTVQNQWTDLDVPGLGALPAPRWRCWTDWDGKTA